MKSLHSKLEMQNFEGDQSILPVINSNEVDIKRQGGISAYTYIDAFLIYSFIKRT